MNWKERLEKQAGLPRDLVEGAVIVTVTGDREAYVENYVSLLEYTRERIRLQAKGSRMEICGEALLIDYFTNTDMKISGRIREVKYC